MSLSLVIVYLSEFFYNKRRVSYSRECPTVALVCFVLVFP